MLALNGMDNLCTVWAMWGAMFDVLYSIQVSACESKTNRKKENHQQQQQQQWWWQRTQTVNLFWTKSLTWIEYLSFSRTISTCWTQCSAGDVVTGKGFSFYTSLIQFYLFTHEISFRQNSILSCRWCHWAASNVLWCLLCVKNLLFIPSPSLKKNKRCLCNAPQISHAAYLSFHLRLITLAHAKCVDHNDFKSNSTLALGYKQLFTEHSHKNVDTCTKQLLHTHQRWNSQKKKQWKNMQKLVDAIYGWRQKWFSLWNRRLLLIAFNFWYRFQISQCYGA